MKITVIAISKKKNNNITDKYRIMAVMKVETDLIDSLAAYPLGWAVILLIMNIETFYKMLLYLSVTL